MAVKGPSRHLPAPGHLVLPGAARRSHAFFRHAFFALSPARVQGHLGDMCWIKGSGGGVEGQPGLCGPAGPSPQRDWPQG